jgi:hypothetical protein
MGTSRCSLSKNNTEKVRRNFWGKRIKLHVNGKPVAVQNSGFCPSRVDIRCSYEKDPRIRGFEGLKKRTSNIERPTSNVE